MEQLTKRDRRMLRKQIKHEESRESSKGKKSLTLLGIFLIVVIGASVWIFFPARVEGAPSLSLEYVSLDFGQISQAKGPVTRDITVLNSGAGPLIISSMSSSCMCTSASLVVGGQEGPRYGMHGREGGGFSNVPIPAGGEGILRVRYDPDVHPDFRGAATRIITLVTNDPANPQPSVRVNLFQVN